ncbi:MAG: hypothetical protein AEth_00171 [Candidatus Argoarchaeum ethanivorans]|uniref:Uncharacterized protein n=1 Tax=Candidatus Argoarchaeum ethanivorans TaxID=2608793 RepID=A0A8B6SDK9_9EURY|nr:MAG: hypothetical protein AEth_00171 [Candidatus Argoarchaeum ethanivorans]
MNIIKNVEITNYKGIEETQFSCGSINIIVRSKQHRKIFYLRIDMDGGRFFKRL